MAMMPKASMVPRSGCLKIRNAGIATTTTARTMLSHRSARGLRASRPANATMTATLASSAGWNCPRGPRSIHRCAPCTVLPSGVSTRSSVSMLAA